MAATYPVGVKAFPTYANGDQVTPTTINDPNQEITAIEHGLKDGLAHDLVPDLTGNNRNLGTAAQQWHNANFAGELTVTGTIHLDGTVGATNLAVTGNVNIDGELKCESKFQVSNKFEIDNISGNLLHQGNAFFHALLHTDGDLTVGGNATITGTLTAAGGLSLTGGHINIASAVLSGPVGAGGSTLIVHNDLANTGAIVSANSGTGLVAEFQTAAGTPTHDFLANGDLNIAGNLNMPGTLDLKTAILSTRQAGIDVGFTTPTTIYTATRPNSPLVEEGGLVIVHGTQGVNDKQFLDLLLVMSDGFSTVIAHHEKGAAEPRLYSWSGLNLQLVMFTTPAKVVVLPMLVAGQRII